MSICSGARIVAALGMLDGLEVTTHHHVATHLQTLAPAATVVLDRRFIDTGKIVTTGGISAGMDGGSPGSSAKRSAGGAPHGHAVAKCHR